MPQPTLARTLVVNIKKDRYDIYIGRPSEWGNPFNIGEHGSRDQVVTKYREWLFAKLRVEPELWEKIHLKLGGKRLGCFCAPLACHGDVLAEVADQGLSFNKEVIQA